MYLYTSSLNPEDAKRAFAAVDLAVRCGVDRQYASAVMESGDIVMADSYEKIVRQAAAGMMQQYESQHASPDRARLVDWKLFRSLGKR